MTASQHTTPIIIPALDAYSPQSGNTETVGSTVVNTGNAVRVAVGTRVGLNDGGEAIYLGPTMSAISTYNAVVVDSDLRPSNLTTTNAGTISKQVAWAMTSIAVSSYGWFQTSGRPIAKLAGDTQDRVILFTSATAGLINDVTVSECLVAGAVSKNSIGTDTSTGTLIVGPQGAYVHPHANPA